MANDTLPATTAPAASPTPPAPHAPALHTQTDDDGCGCGHEHHHHDHSHDHSHSHFAPVETFTRGAPKVGRNDPCPCGSGNKYKKCCIAA